MAGMMTVKALMRQLEPLADKNMLVFFPTGGTFYFGNSNALAEFALDPFNEQITTLPQAQPVFYDEAQNHTGNSGNPGALGGNDQSSGTAQSIPKATNSQSNEPGPGDIVLEPPTDKSQAAPVLPDTGPPVAPHLLAKAGFQPTGSTEVPKGTNSSNTKT